MNGFPDNEALSISEFVSIKIGMKYEEVLKTVGSPHGSMGSGLVWNTYNLENGLYVKLFFGSENTLIVMHLVDPDGREFELKQEIQHKEQTNQN